MIVSKKSHQNLLKYIQFLFKKGLNSIKKGNICNKTSYICSYNDAYIVNLLIRNKDAIEIMVKNCMYSLIR